MRPGRFHLRFLFAEDATASNSDGYSLLELLVALALTAVIATMMGAVILQLRPIRQIQAKYETRSIAADLEAIIRDDLGRALHLPLLDSESQQPMIGGVDSVRFVGVVKTGFRAEGLREVSYSLEPGAKGKKKLVRTIDLRRFGNADHSMQVDTLFEPVETVAFRYLSQDPDGKRVWMEGWDRPDALPLSVTVDIGLPETGKVSQR
jgi:prepilin-type N-terminal cleavage/methylation domain-containing protein